MFYRRCHSGRNGRAHKRLKRHQKVGFVLPVRNLWFILSIAFLATTWRVARSRRATARRSYRSSLTPVKSENCFSNRPVRVKHFQAIHRHSVVDVTHGLVLLFGISTKALPSRDSRTRWNNLDSDLAVRSTVEPSSSSISPHPSSREGHHHSTASVECSPIAFDPAGSSCCRDLSGPAEFGAVKPYPVHDHGQPTRQRHDRLLQPAVPGDLHRPGLEPRPFF
jgi:hypothetical protein